MTGLSVKTRWALEPLEAYERILISFSRRDLRVADFHKENERRKEGRTRRGVVVYGRTWNKIEFHAERKINFILCTEQNDYVHETRWIMTLKHGSTLNKDGKHVERKRKHTRSLKLFIPVKSDFFCFRSLECHNRLSKPDLLKPNGLA